MPIVLKLISSESGEPFNDSSNKPLDKNAVSTETQKGGILLATQAEANAGTNDSKALTPLKLKNAINNGIISDSSETQNGLIRISTNNLSDLAIDNLTAISPLQLKRQFNNFPSASTTIQGKIQISNTAENTTGTDNTKAITPKGLQDKLGAFTVPGAAPTGSVVDFAGSNPPTGYLVCDGSAIVRSDYPALFSIIGVIYGSGNGTTTFNLPDCRGRITVGSGTGTSLTQRILGTNFGAENHTLTIGQMPKHSHIITNTIYTGAAGPSAPQSIYVIGTQPTLTSNSLSSNSIAGSDQSHNNCQPSIVFNKIIKT